jgi:hypothetical protein
MTPEGAGGTLNGSVELLTDERRVELEEEGYMLRDDVLTFWEARGIKLWRVERLAKEIAKDAEILKFKTLPTRARRSRHASPGGAPRYFFAPTLALRLGEEIEKRIGTRGFEEIDVESMTSWRARFAEKIKNQMLGDK